MDDDQLAYTLRLAQRIVRPRKDYTYTNAFVIWKDYPEKCKWKAVAALFKEGTSIIPESNSYFKDKERLRLYEEIRTRPDYHHYISQRILKAGANLRTAKQIYKQLKPIEGITLYLTGAFTNSNSGHELSELLSAVHWIRSNKVQFDRIVIINDESKVFRAALLLLETSVPIVRVQHAKPLMFEKLIVPPINHLDIAEYPYLWKELCLKCQKIVRPPKSSRPNILLIKTHLHGSVNSSQNKFICKTLLKNMPPGWTYVNPEKETFETVISLVSTAHAIAFSFGAICYTYMNAFSPKAKLIYLRAHKQKITEFYKYLYDRRSSIQTVEFQDTNLDDNPVEHRRMLHALA